MTIQEFIEKTIEGGYDGYSDPFCIECACYITRNDFKDGGMFLDPKAWEAVGKVEGWGVNFVCKSCQGVVPPKEGEGENCECGWFVPQFDDYKYKMHAMIDHICDGGTIEGYLETL